MIRFSCERESGLSVEVVCHEDADAPSLVEAFRSFMLAAGYHPNTVDEVLGEEG